MTNATRALIDELTETIDEGKYLILSGGPAVGKTYLASAVANNAALPQYDLQGPLPSGKDRYEIITELISIHPSLSYEDVVSGISIETSEGIVDFHYEDKIFLQLLGRANQSWEHHEAKKYFLILDDIGRGPISGILGDVLPLLEPHGAAPYNIIRKGASAYHMTPNFYIIATRSITISSVEEHDYGFFRHFYARELENDYRFMSDSASKTYSNYDTSANALYDRARRIVTENLRHRYQLAAGDRDRYMIGHGVFKEPAPTLAVRHLVLPMLKQYIKDGVLDRSTETSIAALEKTVAGRYTKDYALADTDRISIEKKGVSAGIFFAEGLTHQPLVNLISRIKEQGLLSDSDIYSSMLFDPQVLIRRKARLDKVERQFPSPGYLCVRRSDRDLYTYGTTRDSRGNRKSPRFLYSGSKKDSLVVDGIEYAIASEMQPGEYTRWYEELDSGDDENERYSSSPNSIMFRILRSYYRSLEHHYSSYLADCPEDDNISRLRDFAAQEYRSLVSGSRRLHPEISDEKDVNAKANDDFRALIRDLCLLWKDRGETINVGGQTITVEGVYKVDNTDRYEEYSKAMDLLDIHQMIMQGPPGTSKTYSAREFLRYAGRAAGSPELLTDEALDSLQIKDYTAASAISDHEAATGEPPKIAWDIIQFHPSYGYEDFVRGIEVGTVKDPGTGLSSVSYETVNKILGKMTSLAMLPKYKDTKFYLVIDEINRANLATVFGELIYGLEYRGRSVATPYMVDGTNKVVLPENLYMIGTMNTADKSIGGIDYAIRRRFLFFTLLPDRNVIQAYKIGACGSPAAEAEQSAVNGKAVALFDRIAELFDPSNLSPEYYRDDVQVGHTYFLVSSEEQLFLRFRYQILPILREYYKDGMFQFERPDTDADGWYGLLRCISGEIDINSEEEQVKDIFTKLTNAD